MQIEFTIIDDAMSRSTKKCVTITDDAVLVLDTTADPELKAVMPEDLIFSSATKKWKLAIDDSGTLTQVEQV